MDDIGFIDEHLAMGGHLATAAQALPSPEGRPAPSGAWGGRPSINKTWPVIAGGRG